MNTQAVLSFPKKVFNRYKHVAVRLVKKLIREDKGIFFVVGARSHEWPGMGSELYAKEPVFKETVQKCNEFICEFGFSGVLPNFEGSVDANFFDDETNLVFSIFCLQMGIIDLWKSKGIYPAAVMGLSLGEPAAVYAAGGVSLKDAVRLVCSTAQLSRLFKKEFVSLHVNVNIQEAKALSAKCPFLLTPVFETTPTTVACFCKKRDQSAVERFLTAENIKWNFIHKGENVPYHTRLLLDCSEQWMAFIHPVNPLPLQCDYYSSTLGKKISKNRIIDNDLWFRLKTSPVLAHSIFTEAKKDGYKLMVHIGAHTFLKGKVKSKDGIRVLDSIRDGEPEIEVLKNTERQLLHRSSKKNGFISEADQIHQFRDQFDLMDPHITVHPHLYFKFLRQYGPVHYMPSSNKWFVLDHQLAEYVAKQPEVFSNKVYQDFNDNLVGADPPSHTLIRSLVQPMFSPQALSQLGTFATEKSNELLNELLKKKEFDFVNEFSLKLSIAVTAKMFKLTPVEIEQLEVLQAGHNVYSFEYLKNAEVFLSAHLNTYSGKDHDNLACLMHSFIAQGHLNFEGAANLMKLLWMAGLGTTSVLLSNAAYYLANRPKMTAEIANDEQAMHKFLEECLRVYPPENFLVRSTTRQVELAGLLIPKDALVYVSIVAANRDPAVFDNPDEILLNRPVKRHLSFGHGIHFCIGGGLARIEAKNALKVLFQKMPNYKIAEGNAVFWLPPNVQHLRALDKLIIVPEVNKL